MPRSCVILTIALVGCLGVPSLVRGQTSTTLNIEVLKPTPPITTSDVVRLLAWTSEDVFPGFGFPDYSSSFVVDGFDISWTILSEGWGGVGTPLPKPMHHASELGPLPAGLYELTATWTYNGDHLLVGAPSSGAGTISFTVVPEPSVLVMLLGVVWLVICLARRRAFRSS